jgi:aldehyde dehydrogenase (NAD+)
MGPVISGQACERILGVVEVSHRENHGVLLTGGHRVGGELAEGFFLQPTIFGDVDNASPLAQEEIFGLVLSISPFDTEDEAVCKANDSDFGLGAYVYTNDLTRAHRVAAALDSGMVSVNGMSPMLPTMPFGGVRSSGFGREGGREGLEEFLRPRHITLSLR